MHRKYLLLDTNVWIYMANAHDIDSGETFKKNKHIEIFKLIKDLVKSDEIVLLSNDLIYAEWKRNKNQTRKYIKILETKKKQNNTKDLRMYVSEGKSNIIDELEKDYREGVDKDIKVQEKHIQEVEDYLFYKTTKCPISNYAKIKAAEQAVEKKAPFIGDKKNSMADMLILLSTIEYIESIKRAMDKAAEISSPFYPSCIFISSNKKDFTDTNKSNVFHPDLVFHLGSTGIRYESKLYKYVNYIYQQNLFLEEDFEEDTYMGYCGCCFYDDNVYQKDFILLREVNTIIPNTKELELPFTDLEVIDIKEYEKRAYLKIRLGECSCCSNEYMECPRCEELIETDNKMECENCGMIFKSEINDYLYNTQKVDFYIDDKNDFYIDDENDCEA